MMLYDNKMAGEGAGYALYSHHGACYAGSGHAIFKGNCLISGL